MVSMPAVGSKGREAAGKVQRPQKVDHVAGGRTGGVTRVTSWRGPGPGAGGPRPPPGLAGDRERLGVAWRGAAGV